MLNTAKFRWFALHVRSRHEKAVFTQLTAKNQDVFLPLYDLRQFWGGRWRVSSLPLFPGYVFCRFDPDARYDVLATSGVIDAVKFGSVIAPVDDSEIEAIQLIVESSVEAAPCTYFAQGQKVVMIGGPLTGMSGTLIEVAKKTRVVVSVQLLCRSVSVEVDPNWVIPNPPFGTPKLLYKASGLSPQNTSSY